MSVYVPLPLTDNEGIFGCVGNALVHGAYLYRDVWDHKPPFLFAHFWLLSLFNSSPEVVFHLYAIFIHCLNALLLYFLAKKWLGNFQWLSPLFYFVLVLPPYFQSWTPQPELLMQPLLLAALLFVRSGNPYRWLLAGALSALGFFTKQSFLLYLPLFFIENPFMGITQALWFFAGMDLTAVGIVLPFFTTGRIDDLWFAIWGFNQFYVQHGWDHFFQQPEFRNGILLWYQRIFLTYSAAFIAVLGFVWNFIYRLSKKMEEADGDLVLWLCISIIMTIASGYFFTYYSIVLLPPLSVILPLVLRKTYRMNMFYSSLLVIVILAGPITTLATFSSSKTEDLMWSNYLTDRNQAAKEMGGYLKTISRNGDTLLAWSMEPQVYVYSGLKIFPGLKTPLVDHLVVMPSEEERLHKAFLESPPRFVVISTYDQVVVPPEWLTKELNKKWMLSHEVGKLRLFLSI